jgi:phosphomannomutase/phosphoglucomutase
VLKQIEAEAKGVRVETIDGIKIWNEDKSWILIRPSGTEPIYRIFAEAKSEEEAQALASRYKTQISKIIERSGRRS